MYGLYQTSHNNMVKHINHIYDEGKLSVDLNLSEFSTGSKKS